MVSTTRPSHAMTSTGRPDAERLVQVVAHLQQELEELRAGLARSLHDELGSLLVAAKMDLMREGIVDDCGPYQASRRLDLAIAANRALVEALQPGLLVHVGLCGALRWYLGQSGVGNGCRIVAEIPREERPLVLPLRTAVFRAVQEIVPALADSASPEPVVVKVAFLPEAARIHAMGNGRPGPDIETRLLAAGLLIDEAGGTVDFEPGAGGRYAVRLHVPIPAREGGKQ